MLLFVLYKYSCALLFHILATWFIALLHMLQNGLAELRLRYGYFQKVELGNTPVTT